MTKLFAPWLSLASINYLFIDLQISECAARGGECDESKGRPVCGTDNQTYPTRCHLIRAQCSGHQVSLKHRGSCKGKFSRAESLQITSSYNSPLRNGTIKAY